MHPVHLEPHTDTTARLRIDGRPLPKGASLLLLIPLRVSCPWSSKTSEARTRARGFPAVATIIMVQSTPLDVAACGTQIEAAQAACPLVVPASSMRLSGSFSSC